MSNLYIGVDGKAREIKNMYVGVNGKARKVLNAWVGVNGKAELFYKAAAANTIGSLAIGTEVYLTEASGKVPYIIIGNNHYGNGEITLLRKYATNNYCKFFGTVPSSPYGNQYSASYLKTFCDSLYNDMPAETQEKILQMDIPCRENANSSSTQYVLSTFYPLSAREIANEQHAADGEYFADVFPDVDSRKATREDGTAAAYWTRSATGGMANYNVAITESGNTSNTTCLNNRYIRPACNVLATQGIYIDNNGNYYL